MPAGRPNIPAKITRELFVECGHRCAVCGTELPLERAHIIPWRNSREHRLADLICMCANCHSRADNENWGQKTLREYKLRPWVLRRADLERLGQPDYADAATRQLAEQLEQLEGRRARIALGGGDQTEILDEILTVKRRLRAGPRLEAGDRLGRFTLHRVIGRGGFAEVWKAWDNELEQVAAVKVLHSQFAADRTRIERFFRGARLMAKLDHPSVVRVTESHGEDGGYRFFAMEFLPKGDLYHAVLQGLVERDQALRITLAVGEALQVAHSREYIHRDVKPANILLSDDGEAKLTDFDLVRAGDTTGGTRTSTGLGTALFAAPEAVADAGSADGRADQYGLAVTLSFALYGRAIPAELMFERTSIVQRLLPDDPLAPVLERALAVDPEQRYPSIEDFCVALRSHPIPSDLTSSSRNASASYSNGLGAASANHSVKPPGSVACERNRWMSQATIDRALRTATSFWAEMRSFRDRSRGTAVSLCSWLSSSWRRLRRWQPRRKLAMVGVGATLAAIAAYGWINIASSGQAEPVKDQQRAERMGQSADPLPADDGLASEPIGVVPPGTSKDLPNGTRMAASVKAGVPSSGEILAVCVELVGRWCDPKTREQILPVLRSGRSLAVWEEVNRMGPNAYCECVVPELSVETLLRKRVLYVGRSDLELAQCGRGFPNQGEGMAVLGLQLAIHDRVGNHPAGPRESSVATCLQEQGLGFDRTSRLEESTGLDRWTLDGFQGPATVKLVNAYLECRQEAGFPIKHDGELRCDRPYGIDCRSSSGYGGLLWLVLCDAVAMDGKTRNDHQRVAQNVTITDEVGAVGAIAP